MILVARCTNRCAYTSSGGNPRCPHRPNAGPSGLSGLAEGRRGRAPSLEARGAWRGIDETSERFYVCQ
ncbi:hypothetical protein LX36DRAFT_660776 [Colletotrichum falcatum]|nr:hypothetical protein LX36DRAFT_660776 [Colletotrichum falcatum]